jgi:lysyl endopeptidase
MNTPIRSKNLLLALHLALGVSLFSVAHASDYYPVEELTTAVAPDSGNYGALGQARFINGKYVAPLLTLPELSAEEIATLATRRSAQVRGGKPLQTGVGRDLAKQIAHTGAENVDTDVTWRLLNFSVASKGARALRLGFALEYPKLAGGLTLRFGGSEGEVFEVPGSELTEDAVQWSPIVTGEVVRVEISVARGYALSQAGLKLLHISHMDIDPAASDTQIMAKLDARAVCNVEHVACRVSPPSNFRNTADSVAKIHFMEDRVPYDCTGTLLNNSNSPRRHLLWSAAHCITNQTVANSVVTMWFYEAANCGAPGASARMRTIDGGALLRHRDGVRDTLLLELNNAPPAGAVYAAWSSVSINSTRTPIEVIHHPDGGLKAYTLGTMIGWDYKEYDGTKLTFGPAYRIEVSKGLTVGGSSGAGLFTRTAQGVYQLRGGLAGGITAAACGNDAYSRFGDVYPSIAGYFRP